MVISVVNLDVLFQFIEGEGEKWFFLYTKLNQYLFFISLGWIYFRKSFFHHLFWLEYAENIKIRRKIIFAD